MTDENKRREVRNYMQKNLSDPVNVALAEMALEVIISYNTAGDRSQANENICSRLRYASDRNIIREVFAIVNR
jgi:hypothetical protein